MSLRIYNTLTRSLEEFHPLHPQEVGMYTCGPTVYWDAHIGNMRTYVFEDVLQRVLELEGFSVKRVLNITDVGHLTDDGDQGEDKMEKASRREGRSAWDIAQTYTDLFLQDAYMLNVKIPESPFLCRATDHIAEQILLIQELERQGHAYQTSDGVYFDTSTFPQYGTFSGQKLEEKEEGARVAANIEKRHPSDFALWKFSPTDQKRQMEWESPWGIGFPGWHIECSAMARKYLGQPFDIHCGGVDHIPVHHENEIAQSEAAFGEKMASFWMHGEFLLIDGGKMSKSLGNLYTVRDIEAKGFDPLALRLFFLGAHYRQKQNFTFEALRAAQNALDRLRRVLVSLPKNPNASADEVLLSEFRSALEDDLNVSGALAVLWKTVDGDSTPEVKSRTLLAMDEVFGLGFSDWIGRTIEIPGEIFALAQRREAARIQKDWAQSDALRIEIDQQGWIVEDTKEGFRLEKK